MRFAHVAPLCAAIAAGCAARAGDQAPGHDAGAGDGPRAADPSAAPRTGPLTSPDTQGEPDASVGGGCATPGAGCGATEGDGPPPGNAATPTDAGADATRDAAAGHDDGADARGDASTNADADANADADGGLGLDCSNDAGHPTALGCTGLYANWPSRTLAPGVRAYAPGLALWSDGAEKQRWIELPPGTRIDTSDMNEWRFPTGTKLWKEFRVNGQLVETRFLWKRGDGDWFRTTYAWSADGASATELTSGQPSWNGTPYEIPSQDLCTTCHQGRIDGVLGFEAVSLAAPGATGLTLAELVAEGLVTVAPSAPIVVPGNATESAALGWLHANCGTACHNRSPSALAGATGLFMRLEVASMATVQATDTWQTAVGQPSGFQPAPDAGLLRIAPGDLAHSAIYFRDSFRDDQGQDFQMPPVDTHVVPDAGVALVAAWIRGL